LAKYREFQANGINCYASLKTDKFPNSVVLLRR